MHTGSVPDRHELLMEFSDMDTSEIDEGVREFEHAMKIGGGKIAQ
ncbi:hypothetical protein ACFWO6_28920 [Paenibacillus glucanolyticus]